MAGPAHDDLLLRRERLRSRSSRLRDDWSSQVQALRAPLGVADQARNAVAWAARNPQWPLAAALGMVLLRPGRSLRWAALAWQGWALYRRVQRVVAGTRFPAH